MIHAHSPHWGEKLNKPSDHNNEVIGCNNGYCLPKASLNTKNSTLRPRKLSAHNINIDALH